MSDSRWITRVAQVINLDRYPIDRQDSARGRALGTFLLPISLTGIGLGASMGWMTAEESHH